MGMYQVTIETGPDEPKEQFQSIGLVLNEMLCQGIHELNPKALAWLQDNITDISVNHIDG